MFEIPLPSRRSAVLTCLTVALALLASAGLVTAAVLASAPPAVLPLIVAAGVGLPLMSAWALPPALAALRGAVVIPGTREARMLAEFRRQLRHLPETQRPR
jgi:hypothetical protein